MKYLKLVALLLLVSIVAGCVVTPLSGTIVEEKVVIEEQTIVE